MARINFETVKKVGNAAISGFITTQAESLTKGFLIEYLKRSKEESEKRNIRFLDAISDMVTKDQSLWGLVNEEEQELIKRNIVRLGSLKFFTAEWVIEALNPDFPAIASLFLGWTKAHNWLERQIKIFRDQVGI